VPIIEVAELANQLQARYRDFIGYSRGYDKPQPLSVLDYLPLL